MAKVENYTADMVTLMVTMYNSVREENEKCRDEMVAFIGEELGKKDRSVRAKLSREGVYIAKVPVGKNGKPAVKKETLATDLRALTGLPLVSADAMHKVDLEALIDYITEMREHIEVMIEEHNAEIDRLTTED